MWSIFVPERMHCDHIQPICHTFSSFFFWVCYIICCILHFHFCCFWISSCLWTISRQLFKSSIALQLFSSKNRKLFEHIKQIIRVNISDQTEHDWVRSSSGSPSNITYVDFLCSVKKHAWINLWKRLTWKLYHCHLIHKTSFFSWISMGLCNPHKKFLYKDSFGWCLYKSFM